MRQFAMLAGLVLALGLGACSSAASAPPAQMVDCCKKTADLKAGIPKCCATGEGECCKATKADPSKAAECCKKTEAINAQLPACCKKAAAGEPQACCTAK